MNDAKTQRRWPRRVLGAVVGVVALAGVALFVACYLGLLALRDRPSHIRWVVAALFGTVHGFAFSGVLAEMSLPRARLASSLLGFNVGVELGQLAAIALAWPLWRLLARSPARPRALEVASWRGSSSLLSRGEARARTACTRANAPAQVSGPTRGSGGRHTACYCAGA